VLQRGLPGDGLPAGAAGRSRAGGPCRPEAEEGGGRWVARGYRRGPAAGSGAGAGAAGCGRGCRREGQAGGRRRWPARRSRGPATCGWEGMAREEAEGAGEVPGEAEEGGGAGVGGGGGAGIAGGRRRGVAAGRRRGDRGGRMAEARLRTCPRRVILTLAVPTARSYADGLAVGIAI
jgi:hypothetical protein